MFYLQPIIHSTDMLFSLNQTLFIDMFILASLIVLSSVFFVIFASLAQDSRIVIPVALIASSLPVIFIPVPAAYFVSGGFFIAMIPLYFVLEHKLKTYITFSPSQLLGPSAKIMTTLLVLSVTLGFYLITNDSIKQNGFQVPDQLIDMAIKMSTGSLTTPAVKGIKIAQIPNITQEQIDFLKQNPELLKQYGVDPAMLETIEQSGYTGTNTPTGDALPSGDLTKNLVKAMLNKTLEPYVNFIAPLLSLIFLSTIKFFTSILEIFLPAILTALFALFEKSGFVKFTTEMREVKKMII